MLRCSTRVLLIYDIFKYQAGSITQRTLALMYGQSNIVVFSGENGLDTTDDRWLELGHLTSVIS